MALGTSVLRYTNLGVNNIFMQTSATNALSISTTSGSQLAIFDTAGIYSISASTNNFIMNNSLVPGANASLGNDNANYSGLHMSNGSFFAIGATTFLTIDATNNRLLFNAVAVAGNPGVNFGSATNRFNAVYTNNLSCYDSLGLRAVTNLNVTTANTDTFISFGFVEFGNKLTTSNISWSSTGTFTTRIYNSSPTTRRWHIVAICSWIECTVTTSVFTFVNRYNSRSVVQQSHVALTAKTVTSLDFISGTNASGIVEMNSGDYISMVARFTGSASVLLRQDLPSGLSYQNSRLQITEI